MAALSQYLQTQIANWITGAASFPTPPSSLLLGLSTTDPLDTGTGITELSGGSYARQTITFSAPTSNEATGTVISNSSAITFSMPAATPKYWFIYDNTGTNMLLFGALDAVRTYASGDTEVFNAGSFVISIKGNYSKYLAENIVNWLRGTAPPSAPASVKFGVSSTDPLRDGSGITEPAGTDGYSRKTISFTTPSFTSGTGTSFSNSTDVILGPSQTNPWNNLSYGALFDPSGNQIIQGQLANTISVPVNDTFGLSSGALTLVIS